MRVYPQKNDSTTIYNESLSVWAQLSEAFSQDFDQDRPGTTHETLHSDDHQYQAHESHHDVVAGLPQETHQVGGEAEDDVSKEVDEGDDADQHAFHLERVGVLH